MKCSYGVKWTRVEFEFYGVSTISVPLVDSPDIAKSRSACLLAHKIHAAFVLGAMTLYTLEISTSGKLRNVIPEPLDIFDHISNLGGSASLATGIGFVGSQLSRNRDKSFGKVFLIGSVAAGVGLNIVAETNIGRSLFPKAHMHQIDFVYGIVGSVLATALAARTQKLRAKMNGQINELRLRRSLSRLDGWL